MRVLLVEDEAALLALISEALDDEGCDVTTARDANIGSIFGIGFPAWTGGALQFIYSQGLDTFAQRADELAVRFGPGFALDQDLKATLARHQPVY
mgnify:CR=1 FL=1